MTIREMQERARHEEFITVSEFCLLTRRNQQAMYRAIRRGCVPGVQRVDRSVRLHRLTVLNYYTRPGFPVIGVE